MTAFNGQWVNRGFCIRFGVPAAAEPALHVLVAPSEQRLIADFGQDAFTAEEVGRTGLDAKALYRRGLVNYTDDRAVLFTLSDFYTLLDVFVVAEPDKYRMLAKETQAALDKWYFSVYFARLTLDPEARPSEDAVLTREEALERVQNEERQAYLAHCDCRVLAGGYDGCEKPARTCISFRSGVNTIAHRGISEPIPKSRAAQVIADADSAGLIHTANANTICNCCTDCCYLSRARQKRDAALAARGVPFLSWPKVSRRVRTDWEKCASCGLCEERCPFHLFSVADKRVDEARCVGCSLCVNTCPSGALSAVSIE
jgi:ferredoxin